MPQAASATSLSADWRTHQTHGGGHCLIHVFSDHVTVLLHVMVMCTGREMFESNFRAVLCPLSCSWCYISHPGGKRKTTWDQPKLLTPAITSAVVVSTRTSQWEGSRFQFQGCQGPFVLGFRWNSWSKCPVGVNVRGSGSWSPVMSWPLLSPKTPGKGSSDPTWDREVDPSGIWLNVKVGWLGCHVGWLIWTTYSLIILSKTHFMKVKGKIRKCCFTYVYFRLGPTIFKKQVTNIELYVLSLVFFQLF